MTQQAIIQAFSRLGTIMQGAATNQSFSQEWNISEVLYEKLQDAILRQKSLNGWFTEDMVNFSLLSHGKMLEKSTLEQFVVNYRFAEQSKHVLVVMAGNIPLVGFHDFICVLLSGHQIIAKLSSDDKRLLPILCEILVEIDERFQERIVLTEGVSKGFDAVIATGSDNSLIYFEQYFSNYPHIFRKNRTSLAVLDGTETKEELEQLGMDIFQYYGLGCRNVSHLLIPESYDLDTFFGGIISYGDIVNHNKYGNNYDYNRAVHLISEIPLLENGFLLLKETTDLVSPLAMVHYHRYKNQAEVDEYIENNKTSIQVIIGKNYFPFGKAQQPEITDFADNIDTMKFLESIG